MVIIHQYTYKRDLKFIFFGLDYSKIFYDVNFLFFHCKLIIFMGLFIFLETW